MILHAKLLLFGCVIATVGCTSYNYPAVEINQTALKRTVTNLCAIQPPRCFRNIQSLDTAAVQIRKRFTEFGYTCQDQAYTVKGRTVRNLMVSVGPEAAPRYVVGAHYDVCGNQPGADDNASGIAGLLELARLMKGHETDLTKRIDFVAYTLEEPPFFRTRHMGSYVHAKSLADSDVDVEGMIALDMIGFFSDSKQGYPSALLSWFFPKKANFIAIVSRCGDWGLNNDVRRGVSNTFCPVSSMKGPSWIPGIDFSDHMNYWTFGYDAVLVTDTAFYRSDRYHHISDTPATLDFSKMAEVIKGIYWMLLNESTR